MKQERRDHEVTCLMASLGRLWVGTSVGLILAYPLPRLRDGIPRIQERPQVALHGHSGPISFLIPVQYGPLTGNPIKRRPESVLKKYRVEDSVIQHLPKTAKQSSPVRFEKQNSLSPDRQSMDDNIYEEIGHRNSTDEPVKQEPVADSVYESVSVITETLTGKVIKESQTGNQNEVSETPNKRESELSGEHTYFCLEPHALSESYEQKAKAKEEEHGTSHHGSGGIVEQNKQKLLNGGARTKEDSDKVSKRFTVSDSMHHGVIEELQEKVKKRQSLDDLTDRDANLDNVEMLYPTLARPKTMGHGYQEENLYMRTGMTNPINAKRPDYSSFNPASLNRRSVSEISKTKKTEDFSKKKRSSVSFQGEKDETKSKISVGSSFAAGSAVDTLRKQDSNTILVLSGGDGYKDWKKRQSLPNYRPEEPCLIFWMYKF